MTNPAAKVLIVGPSWVGDMVMAQSLVQTLQQTRTNPCIDILAPAFSGALVSRMPGVRNHVVMPLGHGELGLRQRRELGCQLREERYQQAIVLPNSFKAALVPWFSNIPIRTGWRGELRYGVLNDMRKLDPPRLPRMTQRFIALGLRADAPPPVASSPRLRADGDAAARLAQQYGLQSGENHLAVCPGAEFGTAKRWPEEHFAEVARQYIDKGWQVTLFGSANDSAVCTQIVKAVGENSRCINLAGKTTLSEAIDLMSLATAVVSNDSGLMHIAAALGKPLVALYGPTSPAFTPPLNEHAVVVATDEKCAPCFERECPLGHQRCLRDISPHQVLSALETFSAQTERLA